MKEPPTPQPDLMAYVISHQWDSIESRCRSNPHDIQWRDERGYTALHRLACHHGMGNSGRRAATVASHLFEAAETVNFGGRGCGAFALASDQENRARWSPLHMLCKHGGYSDGYVDFVGALLLLKRENGEEEESKERIMQAAAFVSRLVDRQGRNVLHHLCDSLVAPPNDGTVHALLLTDPSLILCRDKRGATPLDIMVQRQSISTSGNADYLDRNVHLFKLILAATVHVLNAAPLLPGPQSVPSSGPMMRRNLVHCAVRLPISFIHPKGGKILSYLLEVENPRFVKELDEEGNLPLHVMASRRHESSIMCEHADNVTEEEGMYRALLDSYPDAASMKNRRGCYPLELAIQSKKTWRGGVRTLLHANPSALQSMEVDCRLYPQILEMSSTCGSKNVKARVSMGLDTVLEVSVRLRTVFELLRGKPELVRYAPLPEANNARMDRKHGAESKWIVWRGFGRRRRQEANCP